MVAYRNVTAFYGWYSCDNWKTFNTTKPVYQSVYKFTDDNTNQFVMGATLLNKNDGTDFFLGIMNEFRIFSKDLARA